MNLLNNFYIFDSVLPNNFCDDLIRFGEEKSNIQLALTGDSIPPKTEKDFKNLYKQRNSSVAWIDEPWVWNQVQPYIIEANKEAGWNFDLDHSENAQWTKYSETQHYSWHVDSFPSPYNEPRRRDYGLTRKLSATISLEDGDKYEGGDLEFCIHKGINQKIFKVDVARKKGSITVFPSFVLHRVTPVTKGTRYSLVVWTLGFPFK